MQARLTREDVNEEKEREIGSETEDIRDGERGDGPGGRVGEKEGGIGMQREIEI